MDFEKGDAIVHVRYGAGTVKGTKSITLDGKTHEYVCIELTNDKGTLMVRPSEIDPDEIRSAMTDTDLIEKVLMSDPNDLPDHHRSRQTKIEAMLRSGSPRKVARVLRDLIYRERTHRLTETDSRLKNQALRKLLNELTLHPGTARTATQDRIKRLIEKAMDKHIDPEELAATS